MEPTWKWFIALVAVPLSVLFHTASPHPACAQGDYAELKRGVVKIIAHKAQNMVDTGAGIVVGTDDNVTLIVTAHHVVQDAQQIEVVFFDKQYVEFNGKLFKRYHEDLDIAAVTVESVEGRKVSPDLPRFTLGDVAKLKQGAPVSTIGHPLDRDWQASIKTNTIAGLSDQEDFRKLRFTKTAMERGNSGGPVFNDAGALVGMVTKLDPIHAVAVKIDALLAVLRDELRMPTWWRAEEGKTALARALVAQAVATRHQLATREPDEEGDYWWYFLTKKGRVALLQRSVLLAVESVQRFPSPETEQALRDGLAWLTRPMARLEHDLSVYAIVFSPDGKYLATGSQDGTARVWEVSSGREVARMTSSMQGNVKTVAFSPDGQYLATQSQGDTAQVWRLWPEDLLAEACIRLRRNLTLEEWRQYLGEEPYHKTCPQLP